MATVSQPKRGRKAKSQTCPTISHVAVDSLSPATVNDTVYRPIDRNDPDLVALANSIRAEGILTPLHVTLDDVILSGHRRYAAAKLAGLKEVPVIRTALTSDDERFLPLLVECNRQRSKSLDEIMREVAVTADTTNAYEHLLRHREEKSRRAVKNPDVLSVAGVKKRKKISPAKRPFCDAIVRVVNDLEEFWPLSVRQVHYRLLNDPPLRNARKPDSAYANDSVSYKDLCELLTRARLAGDVPMTVIVDETRPVTTWNVHRNPEAYVREQFDEFLRGYSRDYVQSQPNHVEIVAEKLTVQRILESVAMEYCLPLTIGRGYSSLDVRHQMVNRFRNSGKEKLVVLFVSDHDPEGEDLAASFARSLRDDFHLRNVEPFKVALTRQQVNDLKLPPQMKAKAKSSRRKTFVAAHGENVYELEAIPPETLQDFLRGAIDAVLDRDLFESEKAKEREDAEGLVDAGAKVQRGAEEKCSALWMVM